MVPRASAPGPELSFVNLNANSIRDPPHRRAVFRHVQTNYRRWKQQERTRALCDSVKTTKFVLQAHVGTSSYITSSKATIEEEPNFQYNEESEWAIGIREQILRNTSPSTLLKRGNSDPFDCCAIPIAAKENNMLLFYRDFLIPAAYHLDTGPVSKKGHMLAMADWRVCVAGLQDEGTALGFIARNAVTAALCSGSQALYNESLTLRNRSTAILRSKLSRLSAVDEPSIFWHIFILWTTEICDHNLRAAQMHGNIMIKYIKELLRTKGLFDKLEGSEFSMIQLLMFSRYADEQMFGQHLIRPAFDVYDWLPKLFEPFIAAVGPYLLPVTGRSSAHIDAAIEMEDLSSGIKICRTVFGSWIGRPSEDRVDAMLFTWGQHYFGLVTGRLVNLYCNFRELTTEAASGCFDYNHAQQYMALSIVKWVRASSIEISICGRKIYQGFILEKMRVSLEASERPAGSQQWQKWKNARLWALYVGAKEEQQDSFQNSYSLNEWFRANFALQVHNMGLSSWEDVAQILEGFLFMPFLHPGADVWSKGVISRVERQ